MGFFQKLFGKNKNIDARLVGIWETDINDVETVRNHGNVRMTFTKDGKLTYEILSESRIQIMNLVFYTDKGIIISNQPNRNQKPKIIKTH